MKHGIAKAVVTAASVAFAVCAFAATLSPSTIHDDIPGNATIGEIVAAGGGGGGGGSSISTNAVNSLIRSYDATNLTARIGAKVATNDFVAATNDITSNVSALSSRVSGLTSSTNYWNAKQDALTDAQTNAVNSGITQAKVATYDGYATGKQDNLPYMTNAVPSDVIADPPWLTSFTEKDPTVGLTNDTVYASGTSRTFITTHQSLAFTNDYRRTDALVPWNEIGYKPTFKPFTTNANEKIQASDIAPGVIPSGTDTNSVKYIVNTEVGGTNTLLHTDYPSSEEFANDVASVVTNDVGGFTSWTMGQHYNHEYAPGVAIAVTNNAIRWTGEKWQIHVVGRMPGEDNYDEWCDAKTGNGEVYPLVDHDGTSAYPWSYVLDDDAMEALHTTRIQAIVRNALGLAYKREVDAATNGMVKAEGILNGNIYIGDEFNYIGSQGILLAGKNVTLNYGTLQVTDVSYISLGGTTLDNYLLGNFASKSTTLSGYGITDAKIEDGTITLGENTITPITDPQVQSNWTETNTTSKAYIRNKPNIPAPYVPSATDPTFSNATVAVVNDMADRSVTAAVNSALTDILGSDWKTTYGGGLAGLIAAIVAALTWLKNHRAGSFTATGITTPATTTNGTADLSTLFSSANTSLGSTIDAKLPYRKVTDSAADRAVYLYTVESASPTIAIPAVGSGITDFEVWLDATNYATDYEATFTGATILYKDGSALTFEKSAVTVVHFTACNGVAYTAASAVFKTIA